MMKSFLRYILIVAVFLNLCPTGSFAALSDIRFVGNALPVISLSADKNTGLDRIFVAYDTDNLSIEVTTSRPVTWYEYSTLGGGYAQQISDVDFSGGVSRLDNATGDRGYILEDGTERYYFWLTDYSQYKLSLTGLSFAPGQECNSLTLIPDGEGQPIRYTTIHGQSRVLSRNLVLSYYTLEWDSDNKSYEQKEAETIFESLGETLTLNHPPLCDTRLTLSGDRFMKEWNMPLSAETDTYVTRAVDVHTFAEQESTSDDKSNQIASGIDGLGGSAPAEISFYAVCSDAVIHYEWQFARDEDFENILYRFNQKDIDYVFREEGTVYVRFIGSNSDGTCEAYGDLFTVSIGTPELKCPNAFSPGATEGINDEWKVSYRSLVEFECWIFNRQGQQLYHSTDPQQGWDGKYRGKFVRPGVYYYVIEAKGADGRKYNKSGDINIINYRRNSGPSTGDSADSGL